MASTGFSSPLRDFVFYIRKVIMKVKNEWGFRPRLGLLFFILKCADGKHKIVIVFVPIRGFCFLYYYV